HGALVVALIGSVGGSTAGCGSGVKTASDAPFSISSLKSAVWSIATASDDAGATAVLLLGERKFDCGLFSGDPVLDDTLVDLTAEGVGLVFVLDQYAYEGSVVSEWTGTWTSDGSTAYGEPYAGSRSVQAYAFEDGFLLGVDSENPSWLHLDKVEDKVSGSFDVGWWSGSFSAEACDDGWLGTSTSTYGSTDSGF
ncbi:MAG: hypothetical protein ABMB14_37695, partial [Myxococcota bacterium]